MRSMTARRRPACASEVTKRTLPTPRFLSEGRNRFHESYDSVSTRSKPTKRLVPSMNAPIAVTVAREHTRESSSRHLT